MERLYRDLLALRRDDPVLRIQDRVECRATAPTPEVIAIHRFHDGRHRLALVNFGEKARLPWVSLGLPDLPGPGGRVLWWSGDPRYGDDGAPPALDGDVVSLPARCALLVGWS